MTVLDLLAISSGALIKHKIRSGLTLLGIVIGIVSVSSITSIVRGIDRYVADLFGSIGSHGFVVVKVGLEFTEEGYLEAMRRDELPPAAAVAIDEECPSVAHAAPFVQARADVKSGRLSSEDVLIDGTTAEAQYMTDVGLADGRYFTPFEIQHARHVCIIGADVAERIFSHPDPIGRTIYIRGRRFTVIGFHGKIGTVMGMSQDSFVRIPFTTFEKMFGRGYSTAISVQAHSPETVSQAIEETRGVMRRIRKLRPGEDDDFAILTSDALMDMWRRFTTAIFVATIGVGSIALLVGGIGIMNIMFVSVKERTAEIGIRKATGARRRDIVYQFLAESALLCMVGGGAGVGIGLAIAKILSAWSHLPVAVEWWTVAVPVGVAVAIGLFFGVYPAMKAAALEPVKALRYEQ
jgi:putative ABC transport system permease protein